MEDPMRKTKSMMKASPFIAPTMNGSLGSGKSGGMQAVKQSVQEHAMLS